MEQRVDLAAATREGYRAVFALERHVRSAIDHPLLELVEIGRRS